MSREVAFAAVKFGMENKRTSGLLFYGGAPFLERELIYDIVDYSMWRIKAGVNAGDALARPLSA